MNFFQALILGIVQGIAEFFPVSSSGHLKLFEHFFGFKQLDTLIFFDVICHLGTVGSILWVYRSELYRLIFSNRYYLLIFCALIPLFPLVLIIKPIKVLMSTPQFLGVNFLLTSLLLCVGGIALRRRSQVVQPRLLHAFGIGMAQACAVLPGLSRSGATIATSQLLGWSREEGVRFSLLLAIPTILGGVAYECLMAYMDNSASSPVPLYAYCVGALSSFIVGIFALKTLVRLTQADRLTPFVWYCFLLGILTTLYFNYKLI